MMTHVCAVVFQQIIPCRIMSFKVYISVSKRAITIRLTGCKNELCTKQSSENICNSPLRPLNCVFVTKLCINIIYLIFNYIFKRH